MHVEVYSKAVFTCPFDAAEEVSPGDPEDVRVSIVGCYCPVREGDSDVVEAGGGDIFEGLFADEGCIVFFESRFGF